MDAERLRFIGSRGNYTAALKISADNYRLSLQFRAKHLLHRSEEGNQIDMEDTAIHETTNRLAQELIKSTFRQFV